MTTDFTQSMIEIQPIQFQVASCFVTPLFKEVIVCYYYYLDMALLLLDVSELYEVKKDMVHFH